MADSCKYVELDVHKETIAVVLARTGRGEPKYIGRIEHRREAVKRLCKQLDESDERLRFCYEAGPCGYGLYRQLVEAGYECAVVTPSLVALKLARQDRAGELTAPPRRPDKSGRRARATLVGRGRVAYRFPARREGFADDPSAVVESADGCSDVSAS